MSRIQRNGSTLQSSQVRVVFTSEVEDAVEELVGHQRMRELPEEGLQEDGCGVNVLLLKADRLSPVNFLDEFLDGGGTG